jgi:hypothetical protein
MRRRLAEARECLALILRKLSIQIREESCRIDVLKVILDTQYVASLLRPSEFRCYENIRDANLAYEMPTLHTRWLLDSLVSCRPIRMLYSLKRLFLIG